MSLGVFFYTQAQGGGQTTSSPNLQKGLVGHWTLSQEDYNPSTNQVKDLSPYSNHGTNYGATFIENRKGIVNSALNCGTRANSYKVAIVDDDALKVIGSQTISLWLKPTDISAGRQNPYNKAYGGEGTITQETNGRLSYYWGRGGGNSSPYQGFQMTNNLQNNQWAHVVIVRDLDEMKLRWYKNGVLTNQTNASYSEAIASPFGIVIGAGYAGNYAGIIDDVRLYNRALSAEEVDLLYSLGR